MVNCSVNLTKNCLLSLLPAVCVSLNDLHIIYGQNKSIIRVLRKRFFFFLFFSSPSSSQQAHDVKMTSHQRRCDVMTSHRRRYDVIFCTICPLPSGHTTLLTSMRGNDVAWTSVQRHFDVMCLLGGFSFCLKKKQ